MFICAEILADWLILLLVPFWNEFKIMAVWYAFYSDHRQEAAAYVVDSYLTPRLEAHQSSIDAFIAVGVADGFNKQRICKCHGC